MKNNAIMILIAVAAAFILGVGTQYKAGLLPGNRGHQHLHEQQAAGHGHEHGQDDDHGHGDEHDHINEQSHDDHAHGNEQTHDDQHAHGDEHDHGGHGHGDGKTAQMTVYDDQIEIFLEHPFLVAGKGAEFVTHVSYMKSGLPRTEGPVAFVIQQGQEKPIELVEKAPARDGIYIPTLIFPKPGQWKLALIIPTGTGDHRIDLRDVTVYATQQQADAAPEDEGPDGTSFLKEEQWKWRTLTDFVKQINIDGNQSLAIPELCVVYNRGTAIVYVQVSGETVQKRRVVLGQTQDGMVQVTSGLNAGERVISRSAYVIAQKEQGGNNTDHAPHGAESTGIVHLEKDVAEKHQIISHPAGRANLNKQIVLNGQIELNSDTLAHIVPVISGVVRQVYRDEGDSVKKGDVLAWIESRELADAKAAYLAACERYDMSRVTFEREEKLWKEKISSEQEYLERKQAFIESRIEKRTAEQKLYAIGFDKNYLEKLPTESQQFLTKYELKAPYDGTILSKHLTLGEAVASDHDAFVIADLSTVWANFQIHGKDALHIRTGQKVIVKSQMYPENFECTLSYVSPIVDQKTRTCLARAVLPNESGMHRPGQFIRGDVFVDNIMAEVSIPKKAIQYVDDEPCVFVKTDDGFKKRIVQLGHTTKEHVEIVAGLKSNEEVVVENAFLIKSELEKSPDAYGGHGHPH